MSLLIDRKSLITDRQIKRHQAWINKHLRHFFHSLSPLPGNRSVCEPLPQKPQWWGWSSQACCCKPGRQETFLDFLITQTYCVQRTLDWVRPRTSMRPMQLDRKSMRNEKSEATLSICVASAIPHRASSVATISCLTASSWLIWAKFSWLMRLRNRCWSGWSTWVDERQKHHFRNLNGLLLCQRSYSLVSFIWAQLWKMHNFRIKVKRVSDRKKKRSGVWSVVRWLALPPPPPPHTEPPEFRQNSCTSQQLPSHCYTHP